ncbi:hypothetical protein PRUPE_1G171900 [Prunus persica]|uniref:Uncharacterized protein n=1 Tax=Prunus persica TaxID=3760 RepID=A0A251QYP7_PRUPE|nr:hypothetical protein PRUPE_1G171900 [Prunus persica]
MMEYCHWRFAATEITRRNLRNSMIKNCLQGRQPAIIFFINIFSLRHLPQPLHPPLRWLTQNPNWMGMGIGIVIRGTWTLERTGIGFCTDIVVAIVQKIQIKLQIFKPHCHQTN